MKPFRRAAVPVVLGVVCTGALIALAILHDDVGIGTDAAVSFLGTVLATTGAILGALYVERTSRAAAASRSWVKTAPQ